MKSESRMLVPGIAVTAAQQHFIVLRLEDNERDVILLRVVLDPQYRRRSHVRPTDWVHMANAGIPRCDAVVDCSVKVRASAPYLAVTGHVSDPFMDAVVLALGIEAAAQSWERRNGGGDGHSSLEVIADTPSGCVPGGGVGGGCRSGAG